MSACPRCGAEHDGLECQGERESDIAQSQRSLIVGGCYRIESELGHGAMGVVYRAHDEWLNRPVALKLIASSWSYSSDDADSMLRKEAQALASIRSEHVVQVYAFGEHEGSYFFAMEYVHGNNLSSILRAYRDHGSLIPLYRILTILERIAVGVGAVHAAGLLHRDIKPGNIVIEEDTGRPVLVDLGLASPDVRALSSGFTGGTPHYMSPEQAGMGGSFIVGPWSDVYSFACTAFEMLTGRPPFREQTSTRLILAHVTELPPSLSSFRPDLAALDPIFARSLAKDPKERYATCVDMTTALLAAAAELLAAAPPPAVSRLTTALPSAPLRVLTVDDDPAFRRFVTKATGLACRGKDHLVDAAGSGEEAIARARQAPPDVVVLDFDMPGLDGVETLSYLRALPEGDRARVVVLSSRLGAQDRWRFSVLGVKDFLAKPIDLRRLIQAIADIVQRVRSSRYDMPTRLTR